jgi:hypothetical protein
MGALIQAGQDLVAGTGPGQLNQYYGLADTTQTTVTAAAFANLSTPYVIPAGEPYADAAYELSIAGAGVWGGTQQELFFSMYLNGTFGLTTAVAAAALSASAVFTFSMRFSFTCADGISEWWGDLLGNVIQVASGVNPGTAANNGIPLAGTNSSSASPRIAAVSAPVTAAIQAKWNATTGAPTITNYKTTFRKVA